MLYGGGGERTGRVKANGGECEMGKGVGGEEERVVGKEGQGGEGEGGGEWVKWGGGVEGMGGEQMLEWGGGGRERESRKGVGVGRGSEGQRKKVGTVSR